MCRRVECSRCGRPTFAGCGAHVDRVLAGDPPSERCHCDDERPRGKEARGPATRRPGFPGTGAKE
jgi:hypothetical protein